MFSPLRLFTSVGSNITNVDFSVPGTGGSQDATVSGFGAVFADVDLPDSTFIEFFDINGLLLDTIFAPVFGGGLSFAGVLFDAGEQVARVRIQAGTTALAMGVLDNPDQQVDLAAMDDFIYDEPTVPEPTTLLLSGFGLAGICGRALRRRRSVRAQSRIVPSPTTAD